MTVPRYWTCEDCGDERSLPFYTDPRNPPLDEGNCLCSDCYLSAVIDAVDQAASDMFAIIEQAAKSMPELDFDLIANPLADQIDTARAAFRNAVLRRYGA